MTRDISQNFIYVSDKFDKEKQYWLDKLSGELVRSHFSHDYSRRRISQEEYARDKIEMHIPGELSLKLLQLAGRSDYNLYMVLLAVLNVLLHKYTGNEDILVTAPIYKQRVEGEFLNTVLIMRNSLSDVMTFKELLMQVKNCVVEANKHSNYPIKKLLSDLDISRFDSRSLLFETVILLENIHEPGYIEDVRPNVWFSFRSTGDSIEGRLEYNVSLYKKDTVERIAGCFIHLLGGLVENMNLTLGNVDWLLPEERHLLLEVFNNTGADYPAEKTVARLFAGQARKTPDRIAVTATIQGLEKAVPVQEFQLSCRALNEKSNRLARHLRKIGVKPDTIVGILMGPSAEVTVSILGVLKAGGAFLPIDNDAPQHKILSILAESGISFLITETAEVGKHTDTFATIREWGFAGPIIAGGPGTAFVPDPPAVAEKTARDLIILDELELSETSGDDLEPVMQPADLAYTIFTSGSTGKPKGVLLKNQNLVNYTGWFSRAAGLTANDRGLLTSSFAFDLGYTAVFSSLLAGLQLHILPKEVFLYPERVLNYIIRHEITYIKMTPSLFATIINSPYISPGYLETLRIIVLGGEDIQVEDVEKVHALAPGIRIMNHYGPTEATIGCIACFIDFADFGAYKTTPVIGKPISNMRAYILDKQLGLLPVNVPGQLCISGAGVGKGYLDNEELNREKFRPNPFREGETLYLTGDLARWLPDGNIQFLGRIDNQVKIRGYRLELGEIENTLMAHSQVKETVVLARQDQKGTKYLCAYVVADSLDHKELRDYLLERLPECMIPAYFIPVDRMPLTPNGKIDRKKLPEPELGAGQDYAPPETDMEKKLVDIWSEVLAVEQNIVGIDSDFFALGGNSLKAVTLVSKIHKELDVKIRLGEIFIKSTVRQLAPHLETSAKDKYITIEPVEEKEYYPLSSAQKRMYILQQMDVNSVAYNVPRIFPLQGPLHRERLETNFKKLIDRHESLRTSFEIAGGEIVQRIHRTMDFQMEYYTVGSGDGEQDRQPSSTGVHRIVTDFVRPFDLSEAPLLRVGLILTDEKQHSYILRVDMHHIISDGVSAGLYIRDFLSVNADRELPPLRLQYKDYAQWQNNDEQQQAIKRQEAYWLKELAGELPVLNLPTDYPRPAVLSSEGDSYDFVIGKELTGALHELARQEKVTFYMVMAAIYNVMLAKITGQEDIITGTVANGRQHTDLERVIGMFVNTVVLRNFPKKEETFSQFLKCVKQRTLEAFDNQDCQFEDLVEKVVKNRDLGRNPLFDVLFELIDSTSNPGIETPPQGQAGEEENPEPGVSISKFDLTLTVIDRRETLLASFEYRRKLFKIETIQRFTGYFKELASSVTRNAHIPIADIEIISDEEEQRLLAAAGENVGIEAAREDSEKDVGDHMKADFDF
jgi:amino acid adenylation domain-containing protein